ncbi:MAG: CDP-diacylglycerol--serine O-phosphatidyltransferase [Bacteroidota bacterium]
MKLFNLPNFITMGNALCGCLAITFILGDQPDLFTASLLVLAGAVLDFFDGFAARLLKISSPLGGELDSLADVITFGLVPAFIARHLLLQTELAQTYPLIGYFPLIIALFSALRLAKFNVDTRQSLGFIGLPTPANTLLWIAFPLTVATTSAPNPFWIAPFISNGYAIMVLAVISSFLLISEIPLIALKFKGFGWKGNESKFVLVAGSVVLGAIFQFAALPLILVLYVGLSVVFNNKSN